MSEQASFSLRNRNPDVLTCIANLSNDEVFTPPVLANQMLDLLTQAWAEDNNGANLWEDKNVKFLDPCTKSGVFLREITTRLTIGLENKIPNLEDRVEHILSKQVFGIGITKLTSLLARRSVYCSKNADGEHSIAKSLKSKDGNIWFQRVEHTWKDSKCVFCGTSKAILDRDSSLENYAYAFVHTKKIKERVNEIFGGNMQFDVIIGNPPYQLNDGGGAGSSASPLYHQFIEQAKQLDPRYLSMVIPSKWFSGGKGLNKFRSVMLSDKRIRNLVDFPNSREAFNGVDVAGGVMYFLWIKDKPGSCEITTIENGEKTSSNRLLDEHDVFIRDNKTLQIINKIKAYKEQSFSHLVSARRPFGIDASCDGDRNGDLYLYCARKDGKILSKNVPKGNDLINSWKVLISKTSSEHAGQTDKSGRKRVFSRIEVMPPKSVATESYLIIGPFDSELEAINVVTFLRTKFVRFLVSSISLTQNMTRSSFAFVPNQSFKKLINDEFLYEKYKLTENEINAIDNSIRPMENGQNDE
jgi:site-specific DNA-methyltransferase (adenine-specific)